MKRVVAAGLLLAACSQAKPAAVPVPVVTTAPAAPSPSAPVSPSPSPSPLPCGQPAAQLAQLVSTAAGRNVLVFTPAAYDPAGTARYPVVVALHGYDQQAATFASATGVGASGAADGAVVLVPQGLGTPAGWNVPNDTSLYADDVGMIRTVVATAVTQACGDPAKVVVAGLSDGADMAVTAACALPTVVRAVLLVSASTGPSPTCAAIGVVQVHGTADPIDAYTGRAADTRRGFGSVKAAGAEKAFAEWSALGTCTGHTDATVADLRRLVGTGCAHPVELIAVQGGGHTWPSGTNAADLGRTTTSTNGAMLLDEALASI